MASMFDGWIWGAVFNQPLDNWDVSNVLRHGIHVQRQMLHFNQDISNWNVSNVTKHARYVRRQPTLLIKISTIGNVSNVTNMSLACLQ